MMNPKRCLFTIFVLAGFAAGFGCLFLLQDRIDDARQDVLRSGELGAKDQLIELGSTVMLGSFRTVAVDYLWYRAGSLKDRREWAELDGVIRLIAKVQPTDLDAYEHLIWEMAYNVQFDAPTVVDAWKWVRKAIEFGERGVERNPNHPEIWNLYWKIGWVYFNRCGTLPGERARYFEEQVKKEHDGKSPFLVAADWFEKAWIAATEQPGAKSPNLHRLSLWAYAYSEYAKRAEKAGDFDTMINKRKKAIEIHETIAKEFREYEEIGDPVVEELRELIRLHEGWRKAQALRKLGDVAGELKLRLSLAGDWCAMLKKQPAVNEFQRNVDRSANELEELAGLITNPAERPRVLRRVMEIRFLAADPRRRNAQAVKNLRKSVLPYEQRLGTELSRGELLANADLIPAVARIWTRLAVNSSGDKALIEQAAKAIHRYDRLYEALSRERQKKHFLVLCDQWYTLISLTDIDSPQARRRVKQVASGAESQMLPACQFLTKQLHHLGDLIKQGAPITQQQQTILSIRRVTPQVHALTDQSARYWLALLRKDAAYRQDAKIAEARLRTIAEALDKTVEAAEHVLGHAEEPRDKSDPRSLQYPAASIWQMLRQFNPRSALYFKKGRRLPKRRSGPVDVHDLGGQGGHEH